MNDYMSFFQNTTVNYYNECQYFNNKWLEDYHEAGMHEYSVIRINIDNNIGSLGQRKEFCIFNLNQINGKHSSRGKDYKYAPCKMVLIKILRESDTQIEEMIYVNGCSS